MGDLTDFNGADYNDSSTSSEAEETEHDLNATLISDSQPAGHPTGQEVAELAGVSTALSSATTVSAGTATRPRSMFTRDMMPGSWGRPSAVPQQRHGAGDGADSSSALTAIAAMLRSSATPIAASTSHTSSASYSRDYSRDSGSEEERAGDLAGDLTSDTFISSTASTRTAPTTIAASQATAVYDDTRSTTSTTTVEDVPVIRAGRASQRAAEQMEEVVEQTRSERVAPPSETAVTAQTSTLPSAGSADALLRSGSVAGNKRQLSSSRGTDALGDDLGSVPDLEEVPATSTPILSGCMC